MVMEDDTKNQDSRKDKDQESHPILSKDTWTESFTDRLLVARNNNHNRNDGDAFVLLENVMESGRGNSFCNCLRGELDLFLEKLKPARTKGDNNHADTTILELLQSMGTQQLLPDHQHKENQQQQKPQIYSSDSVRGDKNLFISREYRRRDSFATRNPYLNRLIATLSNTFEREFNSTSKRVDDRLKLDLSMTSVQIALYPGDGKSGYRRHCDRHNSCKEEETGNNEADVVIQQQLSPDPLTPTSKNERIITAIYYLTDDDWDAELDGGALRMFHTDNSDSNSNTDATTTVKSDMEENGSSSDFFDVVPFRDRMVVFRSDRVEHQVMPSLRRPRLAITLWFYGTIEKLSTNCDSIIIESGDKTSTNDTESIISRELISSHGRHLPPPLPISSPSSPPLSSIASPAAGFDSNSVPTIFVSIASYRDSETRPTLDALFSTAKNPSRIFAGIVVQLEEKVKYDEDIWNSIMAGTSQAVHSWKPQPNQVRCIRLNARDATGPCYARGLCQTLFRGEDYFMQIDSHMRFRKNWDEYLIQTIQGLQQQQYHRTSNEKGQSNNKIVLTAYPVGYTLPNNIPQETRGTYLVPWKFDKNGMLRQRGRLLKRSVDQTDIGELNPNLHKPVREYPLAITHARRQYLYAGGFNFGPAEVITDVPYDMMGMHHLFFGEELSMSVRLFTHGYDLYCPNETVCYHLWSRAHRPKTIDTATATSIAYKQRLQKISMDKVKQQLLGDQIGKPFGLGKARTAAAFADKLGVDFRRQTFAREDWEFGELCSADFVGEDHNGVCSRLLFPEDSVEAKVASLDTKAKELIGMFLMGIN